MTDVIANAFISHIHEDDAGLAALKGLLADNGLALRDSSVTSDKPNNANSEAYIKSEILAPRIKWAGVVVVLLTPQTKESEWVNWEIEYAHRLGKRIVGVWAPGVSGCELPAALDRHGNAVVGWSAEGIVSAILGDLNDWVTPSGELAGPRSLTRYSC